MACNSQCSELLRAAWTRCGTVQRARMPCALQRALCANASDSRPRRRATRCKAVVVDETTHPWMYYGSAMVVRTAGTLGGRVQAAAPVPPRGGGTPSRETMTATMNESRKAPIPFRPNTTVPKFEDWSSTVSRQPHRYPGGLKKSDVGGLPGNLGCVGRHRRRQVVGQRVYGTGDNTHTLPVANTATLTQSLRANDTRSYFHNHTKRELGNLEPTAAHGVRGAVESNNPACPTLPYGAPPQAFMASQTLGGLSGTISATRDYGLTQAPGDMSVIRSLKLVKPVRAPALSHLERQIEEGMVLRSAPAGATKPERFPVALPPTAPDSSFTAGRLPPCRGPALPPAAKAVTRLGSTVYPRTNHLVQNEPESAGFSSQSQAYRVTSRGLDLTWQKEEKIARALVAEHKVARKAHYEDNIQRKAFKVSTDGDAMELARATARGRLQEHYTEGVAHTENFRQKAR